MNNFNNFLSHLNSFGSHKKPYMGGNYKNKKSFKRIDDITPTPADNNQAPTATPVVTGYNYPETMVGSLDNMNDSLPSTQPSMPSSTQPMSSTPPRRTTPSPQPESSTPPRRTTPSPQPESSTPPAAATPTAPYDPLAWLNNPEESKFWSDQRDREAQQTKQTKQSDEVKGRDAWERSRAGTFDYGTETLPSANYDPVVVQGREALEASKKFREDNDARDAVRTTDRNKVRDAKQAEEKRMRNSSEQWERDFQAKLDEKEQQRQAGPEHQARLAEIERMNAELPANPNNSSAGDERPRDTMGNLLEANNITNFADHMKFLSFHSGKLNEEDASYDDAESSRIRGANERSTTGIPQDPETIKNLDKAWDYRNSWLAKGTIKDAWNKMTPTQQQQARNYAKSKSRDFSEMDSALNETSNHNIFLNHLNSFFK